MIFFLVSFKKKQTVKPPFFSIHQYKLVPIQGKEIGMIYKIDLK